MKKYMSTLSDVMQLFITTNGIGEEKKVAVLLIAITGQI